LVPHEHALVDENASSTAELIYLMLKEAKQPVDARISTLLACGILADSSYFSNSRPETFVAMGELMHVSNKDVQQMFSLFETPMSIAEKIALLKAARRTKIYRHENFLIVTSHVGAYEAHAASALVLMGADVAFVAAPGKSHTIISARASQQASRMGIDLVDSIFTKLSDDFPGSGGGHRAAAAFTSPSKEYETMLERCVGLVAEALGWETTKLERVD
jgi:nanoRNase/pAp phosphatase (c-di-AMP/oligoRNAs hydrolase)